jgi:hypothetical protein
MLNEEKKENMGNTQKRIEKLANIRKPAYLCSVKTVLTIRVESREGKTSPPLPILMAAI